MCRSAECMAYCFYRILLCYFILYIEVNLHEFKIIYAKSFLLPHIGVIKVVSIMGHTVTKGWLVQQVKRQISSAGIETTLESVTDTFYDVTWDYDSDYCLNFGH